MGKDSKNNNVQDTVTFDDGMEIVFARVAGLDIGKRELTACVRVPGKNGKFRDEVRTFSTMTGELLALADWLSAQGVQVVAMEATGAYWKPVYYLLEAVFDTRLVNPRDVAQVKGRKTDVKDAQWIARLVQHDLVRSCFVPPEPIRGVRELTRQRAHLSRDRTRAVARLEKVLEETGLKISSVASNTLGASTRAMLQAIVAGERDPDVLADLALGRLRAKMPALREALRLARFTPATAFTIGQLLDQIDLLDRQIAGYSSQLESAIAPFEWARQLLTTAPGISHDIAMTVIGAIGTDMSQFPTAAHLASWAGVCPGNNRSAGRSMSAATTHGDSYLRGALGMAAGAIAKTNSKPCYLKSRYQRLRTRRGPLRAQVAIQHDLLIAIWHMLTNNVEYRELGADYYQRKPRTITHRANRARQLLTELEADGYDTTQLLTTQAA